MSEMDATVQFIKAYEKRGCPFSHSGREKQQSL